MTGRLMRIALLAACAGAGGLRAQAPDEAEPELGPRLEIVIADDLVLPPGEQRAVVRDEAGNLVTRPGDIIRYRLTARNTGTEAVRKAELLDPIPAGTEYVPGSARGAGMQVLCSIDGGQTFVPEPVRYRVRAANGDGRQVVAEPGMYTHVKWLSLAPLPPGGTLEATFQVRVSRRQSDDPSQD